MRFTLQRPDLGKTLAGTEKEVERAVTAGMRQASDGLKTSLRDDVVSAGLGERLARTWRGTTYPQAGESLEATAFVWSRAPKLIDAFDRGVTIRSPRGFYLAIPTAAAGAVGRTSSGKAARITPGGWERRAGMRLRFVYRRGRPSLLVAENVRLTSKGVAASPAPHGSGERRHLRAGAAGVAAQAAQHRTCGRGVGRARAVADRSELDVGVRTAQARVFGMYVTPDSPLK